MADIFDVLKILDIIIASSGLGWFLYRIVRYHFNITQLIEERTKEIYILLISVFVIIGIFHTFFGGMTNDEGFFLYAGKSVFSGKIPYLDFSFTQPPLLPYIYGIPQLLFGPNLYVGRLTSLFFGVLTLIFTAKIVEKFGGKPAVIIALALISFNPYTIHFLIHTKTYALVAFFMVLSVYFQFANTRIKNPSRSIVSVSLIWLAVGVRLAVLPAAIFLTLYVLYTERKNIRTAVPSLVTALVVGGLLFMPFYIIDQDSLRFNLLGYHLGQSAFFGRAEEINLLSLENIVGEDFSRVFSNKIPTFFSIVQRFLAILILMFVTLIVLINRRKNFRDDLKFYLIFSLVFSVFLVHFLKVDTQREYPVMIVPLAAILAGYGFSEVYRYSNGNFVKYALFLTVTILILFALLAQGYKTEIDVSGDRGPIQEVEEMANYIKKNTPSDGKLLTFSTFTAFQANREVLPGFEMSVYSYYRDWSDDTVQKYNLVNKNLLDQYITSGSASAILITDFDKRHFIKKSTMSLIDESYVLSRSMKSYPKLGMAGTAYLYLPKETIASVSIETLVLSVEKTTVNYGDVETWSAKGLPPYADYKTTLRWSGTVLKIGAGSADANGEASGSFVVGENIPPGTFRVRVELASDPKKFGEASVDFAPGEVSRDILPKTIVVSVEKTTVVYGDVEAWSAKGLPPNAEYETRIGWPGYVLKLASGTADANGEASGSFVVVEDIPLGDFAFRVQLKSDPKRFAEVSMELVTREGSADGVAKTILVSVEKTTVVYGDVEAWSAKGLPPNADYKTTLRWSFARVTVASGTADANGEASGSFLVGENIPVSFKIRVELASDPKIFGDAV
ncbi:MAG: ArnT family glycosyltransferase, partial [Nitrososphaerales archaeon]